MFEWAFILYLVQYIFAVYAGFVVAMSRELRMNAVGRAPTTAVTENVTRQPDLAPKPTG
jgi:hypothetical protein